MDLLCRSGDECAYGDDHPEDLDSVTERVLHDSDANRPYSSQDQRDPGEVG